jgi:hypothetical protein
MDFAIVTGWQVSIITARINKLCHGLDLDYVDPSRISHSSSITFIRMVRLTLYFAIANTIIRFSTEYASASPVFAYASYRRLDVSIEHLALGSLGSNLQSDEEVHEDDCSEEDSSAEEASGLEGDDDHVNSVCSGSRRLVLDAATVYILTTCSKIFHEACKILPDFVPFAKAGSFLVCILQRIWQQSMVSGYLQFL